MTTPDFETSETSRVRYSGSTQFVAIKSCSLIVDYQLTNLKRMDHSKAGAPGVLKVILEPPSAAKPGQTLYPPLVLSLRTENEHDQQMHSHPNSISDDEQQDGAAISPVPSDLASETANEGSDTVWAFVHLVPDSRDAVQVPISPPHHTATGLKGTLTASPHHAVSPVSEKGVQYIKFEDLSINNIGLFSLRVVLCRMQRVSGHSSLSVGAATTIGCINTRRIFVHPSGYHPVGK